MGNAKRRGSLLERIEASQKRHADDAACIDAERQTFAAEVAAQAARIGMALGVTQLVAEIPVLGEPDADGVPVPTGRKELHPARIVLIGLDALLERLAMMERAVDGACPAGGVDPACECASCGIRKASGMLHRTVEPPVTSGYAQVEPFSTPFLDAPANVPSASAVAATPERFPGGALEISDEIPPNLSELGAYRAAVLMSGGSIVENPDGSMSATQDRVGTTGNADLSGCIVDAGFDPTTDCGSGEDADGFGCSDCDDCPTNGEVR